MTQQNDQRGFRFKMAAKERVFEPKFDKPLSQRNFSINFGPKVKNMNTFTFRNKLKLSESILFKMAAKTSGHCTIMLIYANQRKNGAANIIYFKDAQLIFKQLQKKNRKKRKNKNKNKNKSKKKQTNKQTKTSTYAI